MKLIELLAQEKMGITEGHSKHQNAKGYICNAVGRVLSRKKYPLCEDWPTAIVTRTELELFKCRGYEIEIFYNSNTIEEYIAAGWSFIQLKENRYIRPMKKLPEFMNTLPPPVVNCRCQITPIELPNSIALESVTTCDRFTFRHKSAEVTFTDFQDLRDLIEVILK